MANAGSFVKGDPRRGPGGRKKKPEWLKGKGEDALKKAYEIMMDPDIKPETVLQAARMIAEYDLGKPQQALDISAEVDSRVSLIQGMGTKERWAAAQEAMRIINGDDQS